MRKCQTVEELGSGTGVTPIACVTGGFRLWHMNSGGFTPVGRTLARPATAGRIRRLEETLEGLAEQEAETQEQLAAYEQLFSMETLVLCVCRLHGLAGRHAPDQRKRKGTAGAGKSGWSSCTSDLQALEEQKQACEEQIRDKEATAGVSSVISAAGGSISDMNRALIDESGAAEELNRAFPVDAAKETALREHQEAVSGQESFEAAENRLNREMAAPAECRGSLCAADRTEDRLPAGLPPTGASWHRIRTARPTRSCCPSCPAIWKLFQKKAQEQARASAEHFRDDFIFKIRSAIRGGHPAERRAEPGHPAAEFRKRPLRICHF